MKESIDCAVLMLPQHTVWMQEFMQGCGPARGRLTLHALGADGTRWQPGRANLNAVWSPETLRRAALQLKRYDVCLLPVTLDTLGWTRLALAHAREALQTPLIGISRDLKAAGLSDLLTLGMADFLRDPVCPEELKIRLAQLAAGGQLALSAEAPVQAADLAGSIRRRVSAERIDKMVQELMAPANGEPFRAAKARLVTEFEKFYISSLLNHHHGNISQAAKAAHKNRRAFWELMRKHEIAADRYRERAVG
jgi:DNA-binding NtrC family response regulator